MLRGHPQIFMPELKEPWFFASDMRPRFQRPTAGPLPTERSTNTCALFADAAPSSASARHPPPTCGRATAAARHRRGAPAARIIAILREPASFLRSLHLQLLQNHIETEKDLRTALALEPSRRAGQAASRAARTGPRRCCTPSTSATSSSCAATTSAVPAGAAAGADLRRLPRDNEATVRRVLRFLEVDDTVALRRRARPTRPSDALAAARRLVHAVSVGAGPLRARRRRRSRR